VASILVVEDEVDLNELLRGRLAAEGHEVSQAFDGRTALAMVERNVPDLVVLDWMLPDLDGLSVCRQIRQQHVIPIIMLTARGGEVDKVLGLEVGADDYITKPFSLHELMARVRATLRRVDLDAGAAQASAGADPVQVGPLVVDVAAHQASLNDRPLDLTRTEFQLLRLLVENPGRAFSRDYLLRRMWNDDYGGLDRSVDTHVAHLRRKLGELGTSIQTVWGVGYRFVKPR
jgi:DNA-binding response OmpR family regulator